MGEKEEELLKKRKRGWMWWQRVCVGGAVHRSDFIRSWLVKGKVKETSRRSGGCGGQKNSTEHQGSSHELPVVLVFHSKT